MSILLVKEPIKDINDTRQKSSLLMFSVVLQLVLLSDLTSKSIYWIADTLVLCSLPLLSVASYPRRVFYLRVLTILNS